MPIKTTWLKKGRYLELWDGLITGNDVILSAEERKIWQKQDGEGKYIVLIDLNRCMKLPPIATLRGATKIHPKGKAHFIIFGGGRFFDMVGGMVARFTGYYIKFQNTKVEAIALADSLEKEWVVNEAVW